MARPKALIIEGVEFPVKYNAYDYSRNKIWSKNTGRNNLGTMIGTIITIKDRIDAELTPLTPEKAKILDDVINDIENPFPKAKVLFVDGTQKEMTIYTADVSYHWLGSEIAKGGLITGVKISCIEQ